LLLLLLDECIVERLVDGCIAKELVDGRQYCRMLMEHMNIWDDRKRRDRTKFEEEAEDDDEPTRKETD
jgi:hypothetical protein